MSDTLRSVVISGASTGIGECAARRLDALGWRVFAGVRREEDGRRLAEGAGNLRWILLDVTDHASIEAAAAAVAEATGAGGLNGLVNNAGIAVGSPLEYVDGEALRRQFEVNVFGLVATTQAFLPQLRTAGGRIVNIGSISGRVASPMMGPYSASKHAVEAISDVFRLELAPGGVYTSVIEPGMVSTPIWDKGARSYEAAQENLPPEAFTRYAETFNLIARVVRRGKEHGIAPDKVVDAIVHALTAGRPRPRYLVGRDARLRLLLQSVLPRRWMDALVHRMIRKHGTPPRQ